LESGGSVSLNKNAIFLCKRRPLDALVSASFRAGMESQYLGCRSYGIGPDGNPSFFRMSVKHFDLFAVDTELENIHRNRIASVIVIYNSYDHMVPSPGQALVIQYHNFIFIRRKDPKL
jgi:hypothetical protein